MGRSSWGDRTSSGPSGRRAAAYTARFGSGRYSHGQNDHMALTWYAQGRNIIVPSGHIGYNAPSWRRWLASPQAHNTLVVDGTPFRPNVPTALTGHRFHRTGDWMAFADASFEGVRRSRSALFTFGPDALAVYDQTVSDTARAVHQLWHLPAEFTAVSTSYGAVASSGGSHVHFLQIQLPYARPPGPGRVVRGAVHPAQGWTVVQPGRRAPSPTVALSAQGGRTRMLTLIVPTSGRTPPTVRAVPSTGDALTVTAAWAGHQLTIRLSSDGALTRLA
nr:heparinase II/III family protein [Actinomadura rayongensis]